MQPGQAEKTKRRKQAFYEIGNGTFAPKAQHYYEQAQELAQEYQQTITITMKIVVYPPPENDRFGKTLFSIERTHPKVKSHPFTTEYEAGYAVKDGESIDGILQQDLFLDNN